MIKNINRRNPIFKDAKIGQYRKYFLIFISLCLPVLLYSTTYNIIDIDGTRPGSKTNDWDSDEDFTDCSAADKAYFTWDATYFYFGIDDAEGDYNNLTTFMYFNTDPGGSSGSTSAYAWGENITTPWKADYVVIWKNDTSGDYIDVRDYNDGSSSWDSYDSESSTSLNTNEVNFSVGTNYREVRVKRSILGVTSSTDTLHSLQKGGQMQTEHQVRQSVIIGAIH